VGTGGPPPSSTTTSSNAGTTRNGARRRNAGQNLAVRGAQSMIGDASRTRPDSRHVACGESTRSVSMLTCSCHLSYFEPFQGAPEVHRPKRTRLRLRPKENGCRGLKAARRARPGEGTPDRRGPEIEDGARRRFWASKKCADCESARVKNVSFHKLAATCEDAATARVSSVEVAKHSAPSKPPLGDWCGPRLAKQGSIVRAGAAGRLKQDAS
jgi:hypothetical protein